MAAFGYGWVVMKTLYIIKLGSTFDSVKARFGDFEHWIERALGPTDNGIGIVDAKNGAPLPAAEECAGVVLTGSHAMVTDDLSWSLAVENWIPDIVDAGVPFMGICYGHQLLARAWGGQVGFHPRDREIGTVDIRLLSGSIRDKLFGLLPGRFQAHATHCQSVLQLPPGATHLAASADEVHHAFRIGDCAWGIQFHPEFTADIMAAYIREQAKDLRTFGRDVDKLLGAVAETPAALQTIRNFCLMVENHNRPLF